MPKPDDNFDDKLKGFLEAHKMDDIENPEEGVFHFSYKANGKKHGPVGLVVDAGKLKIFYGPSVVKSKEGGSTGWTKFTKALKSWMQTSGGGGEIKHGNYGKMGDELKLRKNLKKEQQLLEGWWGNKNTSYNDRTPSIKMVVKHNKIIGEDDKRYHHIDKIFLETELGERILVPSKKPSIGRAFARHLAEGGQYNDERWNHIKEIAEDAAKLSGFLRATKNGIFNEGVHSMVTQVAEQYNNLRETISRLQGSRGYNTYFENWQPTLVEGDDAADYSSMFTSTKIDPRIEGAMPVLSKYKIAPQELSEAGEFEDWANTITEAFSAEDSKNVEELVELLVSSETIPVGPDAASVKNVLDDIIPDSEQKDKLFDELDELAFVDADNDSKATIISWLEKHRDIEFASRVLYDLSSTDKAPKLTKDTSKEEPPKKEPGVVTRPKLPEKEPAPRPKEKTPAPSPEPTGAMAEEDENLTRIKALSGLK